VTLLLRSIPSAMNRRSRWPDRRSTPEAVSLRRSTSTRPGRFATSPGYPSCSTSVRSSSCVSCSSSVQRR